MSDLIEKEEVIDAICNKCMLDHKMERRMPTLCRNCRTVKMIQAIPSARLKGEWIEDGSGREFKVMCSNCKCKSWDYITDAQYFDFCPNCGADMRGERSGTDKDKFEQ